MADTLPTAASVIVPYHANTAIRARAESRAIDFGIDFEEHGGDAVIDALYRAMIAGFPEAARAVPVPDAVPVPPEHSEHDDCNCRERGEAIGWNACRDAVLSAAPQPPQPSDLPLRRAFDGIKMQSVEAEARSAQPPQAGWKPISAASPDDIRDAGWVVAVHNDYRLSGEFHTFWLFTKGDRNAKGEGRSDADALNAVRQQIGLPAPPTTTTTAED